VVSRVVVFIESNKIFALLISGLTYAIFTFTFLFLRSAITDILEKDVFSLEELLEEDELLQEVKSRNAKLIDL
jgi:hypothetical protein